MSCSFISQPCSPSTSHSFCLPPNVVILSFGSLHFLSVNCPPITFLYHIITHPIHLLRCVASRHNSPIPIPFLGSGFPCELSFFLHTPFNQLQFSLPFIFLGVLLSILLSASDLCFQYPELTGLGFFFGWKVICTLEGVGVLL